jgi:hypothetical protein
MARIDAYQFGRIVVDGQRETQDLIVLPNRILRNWWRQEGHRLVLDDLQDVLEELPENLLIGTGAHGQLHPDPAVLDRLRARGIKVEALPTATAVCRYGELDPARTAAALHLTC